MKVLLINSAFTDIYGNFKPTAKIGALWISTGFASLAANVGLLSIIFKRSVLQKTSILILMIIIFRTCYVSLLTDSPRQFMYFSMIIIVLVGGIFDFISTNRKKDNSKQCAEYLE